MASSPAFDGMAAAGTGGRKMRHARCVWRRYAGARSGLAKPNVLEPCVVGVHTMFNDAPYSWAMTMPVSCMYDSDVLPMVRVAKVRISWVVRSIDALPGPCGDAVRIVTLATGHIAIVVVDIAGHGPTRAPFSSIIADKILAELLKSRSPAAALACGDGCLRTFEDDLPYAVAFVALINPASGVVVYASAAHELAFTLDGQGRRFDLKTTTPMLGIPLKIHPCDALVQLDAESSLVVATDGIADSRPAGSMDFFGADRAAAAVHRSIRAGCDPAHAVLDDAFAHAAYRQVDDVAVVVAVARSAFPLDARRNRLKLPI